MTQASRFRNSPLSRSSCIKSVEIDDPIPYDANDPDDGPYDPNDEEAVEKFLTEGTRINPARHRNEPPISKAS